MADIKVKMDAQRLVELGKKTAEECRVLWPELKNTKGLMGALSLAGKVAKKVEEVGKAVGLIGEDKKAIAIQIICDLVPDTWVPDSVLDMLLGWAIDRAVARWG